MGVQLVGEAFLDLMLLALTHGTTLVLLTWLASATLLRRCRPSVHAALWTVVLVKFLLPPVLPGAVGLSPLLASLLPAAAGAVIAQPAASHPISQDDRGLNEGGHIRLGPPHDGQPQAGPGRRLPAALLLAYSALVSLFGARALLRSRRMRRRISRLPAAEARLADEVAAAAVKLGLARPPRVLTDAASSGPFVVGAWRPTLVMPASLPERFGAPAREALIIHELAHIRRGDTLVRWLRNAARLLFFFWPPVWWLCRRVERFSEMACDELAVRLSPVSPRAYAETLLDVAKAARRGGVTTSQQIALASRDEGLMAARFEMILREDHGSPPRLPALASAALMAWGLFAVAGRASAPPAGGAAAARPAARAFNEAVVAGNAPRGQAIVSNPAAADAAQGAVRGRPDATRRGLAPARRHEGSDQRVVAGSPPEEVTGSRRSQGRDEARPGQQSENNEVQPREVDLDGDGRISDFEAGYSAGLRYRTSKAGRGASARGPSAPSSTRLSLDAESRRRIEIELREMRRLRPADDTP